MLVGEYILLVLELLKSDRKTDLLSKQFSVIFKSMYNLPCVYSLGIKYPPIEISYVKHKITALKLHLEGVV